MIIYKDIITGDELLSDSFNVKEVAGIVYEADLRKYVKGFETIQLAGENPSIEAAKAAAKAAADAPPKIPDPSDKEDEMVYDIQDYFHLREQWKGIEDPEMKTSLYMGHLKKYMKAVVEALKHNGTDDETIRKFQTGASKYYKKITKNIMDYDFLVGESVEEEEGMLILINFREDGVTPYATLWKHGLTEMKV